MRTRPLRLPKDTLRHSDLFQVKETLVVHPLARNSADNAAKPGPETFGAAASKGA